MRQTLLLASLLAFFSCGLPDATALVGQSGPDSDDAETQEAALTSSNKASVWFPMHEGDSWVFTSAAGATRTVTLTQVADEMGLLQGLGDDLWVGTASSSPNTLYAWDGAAWKVYLRFGYATTVWGWGTGTCTGFKLKRSATGATVTTAAGTFSDTRSIALMQISDPVTLCAPPAVSELTFVPNVGLVGFKTGRGERFTLKSATIDGHAVGAQPVEATVSLDAASYTNTPNTIRCITTPCASNAKTAVASVRFQLVNTSATELSWAFASSCQVDVDILSPSGAVLARSLDTRPCTAAASTLRLSAGQRKTFTVDMPLVDRGGNQLDGDFTVRARLLASGGGAAPSATTPLSVQVQ